MAHEAGKGDKQRPTNKEAFDKHFEEIFGKKPKSLFAMTEEEFNEALGIEPKKDENK